MTGLKRSDDIAPATAWKKPSLTGFCATGTIRARCTATDSERDYGYYTVQLRMAYPLRGCSFRKVLEYLAASGCHVRPLQQLGRKQRRFYFPSICEQSVQFPIPMEVHIRVLYPLKQTRSDGRLVRLIATMAYPLDESYNNREGKVPPYERSGRPSHVGRWSPKQCRMRLSIPGASLCGSRSFCKPSTSVFPATETGTRTWRGHLSYKHNTHTYCSPSI